MVEILENNMNQHIAKEYNTITKAVSMEYHLLLMGQSIPVLVSCIFQYNVNSHIPLFSDNKKYF